MVENKESTHQNSSQINNVCVENLSRTNGYLPLVRTKRGGSLRKCALELKQKIFSCIILIMNLSLRCQ